MIVNRNVLDNSDLFFAAAELIIALHKKTAAGAAEADIQPEDVLFFDIETTGLSPDSSFLYLIGCMYLNDGNVIHEQFFSEGLSDEAVLINAYDDILSKHKLLVHFNGQTFDVPYVEKKRQALNIAEPSYVPGFDIYKVLRPYKRFFGLNSMSQKSLEVFSGLNRQDMYDGGQLIEVYSRYIGLRRLENVRSTISDSAPYTSVPDSGLTQAGSTTSADLLNMLLLHNYEDVLGMLKVAELLVFPYIAAGCADTSCASVDSGSQVRFTITLPQSITPAFLIGGKRCAVEGEHEAVLSFTPCDCSLTITVPIVNRELKLFYADYKNYFYLPAEDSAVHKSIGEFLDKTLRTKCTASNCYTRHIADFLPLPQAAKANDAAEAFTLFREALKSPCYVALNDVVQSPSSVNEYVARLINGLL